MIKIVKGITLSLSAMLLLTACSGNKDKKAVHETANAVYETTTAGHTSEYSAHTAHEKGAKNAKKRRLKKAAEKRAAVKRAEEMKDGKKVVAKKVKFCFKDARSIHYKASEKCKK